MLKVLKLCRNHKGQALFGEYVIVIFVVVTVTFAMTIYVRRALQGRIFDARNAMLRTVRAEYNGVLYRGYEPYYGNRTSLIDQSTDSTKQLLEGGSTGIYHETYDTRSKSQSYSEQLPPKAAD
jgi:hypothetical protein